MLRVENITTDPDQSHTIDFLDNPVAMRIRYIATRKFWYMDINYNGLNVLGIKCVVGVALLKNNNFPFDIAINDDSGNGVDPFRLEDMAQRMSIYIAEPDDMAAIRGFRVEL